MTNQNGRKRLSAAELVTVLSYVRTRANLARQKGTIRAVVDESIILLLAQVGLRPHELCALRIGDLPGTHGEMALWIRDTTGGVARKVHISEDLAERLARFVRSYRNGAQQEDLLLESERGGPLGYMSLYNKVRRIGQEAAIGKLSPAALRRTYIQQLYHAEQDLRYVQEQAGYMSRRSIAEIVKICCDAAGDGANQPEQAGNKLAGIDPWQTSICEACGATITKGTGRRIESGQLLCDGCLRYFRRA